MSQTPSPIIVVGAGIAGLGTGLALDAAGFSVRILDRDPAPPVEGAASDEATSMDDLFEHWRRPGVTQLRHSHVFLARLYNLIRDRYPELRERLLAAGCRELRFADGLPKTLRESYRPQPIDDDLTILSSRRTTLEYVMRRYVQECTGVVFDNETRVTGVVIEGGGASSVPPVLTGLRVDGGSGESVVSGQRFVDATGRTTRFPGWLAEHGIEIENDVEDTGILYFTRHYRLRSGYEEPERGRVPGNGDLGYIKYGIFPADNRCFSLTLALPEDETELRKQIVKPETFDFICSQLPGVSRWTDPERAEPRSKVFGMGKLRSEWRCYLGADRRARINGLYPVGDALLRSNPLYGRGCSSGVLEGHLLAQALVEGQRASEPPDETLVGYLDLVEKEIRPHFDSMRRQDQSAIRRAEKERQPDYRPSLKARMAKAFVEDALGPTMRSDIAVLRAFLPGFHMLAPPDRWLKNPGILWRIFRVWVRGPKRNRERDLYLPKLGPERDAMFRLLGLE